MAKPKAKTLQERFGFVDDDLMKPEHDEIMLWLDESIKDICMSIFNVKEQAQIDHQEIMRIQNEMNGKVEERKRLWHFRPGWLGYWNGLGETPPVPSEVIEVTTTWEYPIKNQRTNFVIGFVDMAVVCSYNPHLRVVNHDLDEDTLPCWQWDYSGYDRFYLEAKTEIRSLGELIRQIRMYQEHMIMSYSFYIVTPDCRFASPLESQGIGTIHYPSGKIVGRA